MELLKTDGCCILCWKSVENENNEDWISISSLSEKHFETWRKYLNLEVGENCTNNSLICTDCCKTTGKLYELNSQLEEIEAVITRFSGKFVDMITKIREEKVIIKNIETGEVLIYNSFNNCQNPQQSVSKETSHDQNPHFSPKKYKSEIEGSQKSNELGVIKIELDDASKEITPKKDVQVKLKRLKFRIRGGDISESNATVAVICDKVTWSPTQYHKPISDGSRRDAEDFSHSLDSDNCTMEEETSPPTNEPVSNGYTVSYRCSRCNVSSSQLSTMEQHIQTHEKRDSEYWVKNWKFLRRQAIRRRTIYT